jgi:endoglucanase
MDAGDWDRRSPHIRISYLQLELFQIFPAFFEANHLELPRNEMANGIPDIVDEALWNLDFHRRLQDTDGLLLRLSRGTGRYDSAVTVSLRIGARQ